MKLAKILVTVINCYKNIHGDKQLTKCTDCDQQTGPFRAINTIHDFYRKQGLASRLSGIDLWWLVISLLVIGGMARYGILSSSFRELFFR
jgi:hypothetical protein